MTSASTHASVGLLDDHDVVNYLMTHPEFFLRHADVLQKIRIPHPTGTNTVSLLERQLDVLRDREQAREKQMHEFVDVAHSNDALMNKIHRLALGLISTRGSVNAIAAIEDHLREDFAADMGKLVVYQDRVNCADLMSEPFTTCLDSNDASLHLFSTLRPVDTTRCSRLTDRLWTLLFEEHESSPGSVALVPLGAQSSFGFLAIGSHNPDHFHPGMGTEFLDRVGELVSEAVLLPLARTEQISA